MKLQFFSLTLLFFELAGRVTATRSSSARNVPQANIAASNACQGYDDLTTSAFSQDASKTHCEALSALQDAKAAYVGSRMGGTTESQVEQGSNARVDNEGLDHINRLGQGERGSGRNHHGKHGRRKHLETRDEKELARANNDMNKIKNKLEWIRSIPVPEGREKLARKEPWRKNITWAPKDHAMLQRLEKEGWERVQKLKNDVTLAMLAYPRFNIELNSKQTFQVRAKGESIGHNGLEHDSRDSISIFRENQGDDATQFHKGRGSPAITEQQQIQLANELFKERKDIVARFDTPNLFGLSSQDLANLGSTGQKQLKKLHRSIEPETAEEKKALWHRVTYGPLLNEEGGTPEQRQRRQALNTRSNLAKKLKKQEKQPRCLRKGKGGRRAIWTEQNDADLLENVAGGATKLGELALRVRQSNSNFKIEGEHIPALSTSKRQRKRKQEAFTRERARTTLSSSSSPSAPAAPHEVSFHVLSSHPPAHPPTSHPAHSPTHHPAHSIRFDPFAPLVQDNDLPDTLKFLLNGPEPHEKSGHAPPSAPPPSQLDDSLQGMLLRHL